jgi:hypothetical protein
VSERKKSQKGFVAVTLITVLAIALVLVVYAALLGSIPGGEVTVGGVTGNVYYSNGNGTWADTLKVSGIGVSWYARFNTPGNQYTGPVSISWQLQQKQTNGTYTNLGDPTATSISLTTASQTIYASSDGSGPGHDWSQTATTPASYRVVVTIQSTG